MRKPGCCPLRSGALSDAGQAYGRMITPGPDPDLSKGSKKKI